MFYNFEKKIAKAEKQLTAKAVNCFSSETFQARLFKRDFSSETFQARLFKPQYYFTKIITIFIVKNHVFIMIKKNLHKCSINLNKEKFKINISFIWRYK